MPTRGGNRGYRVYGQLAAAAAVSHVPRGLGESTDSRWGKRGRNPSRPATERPPARRKKQDERQQAGHVQRLDSRAAQKKITDPTLQEKRVRHTPPRVTVCHRRRGERLPRAQDEPQR